MSQDDFTPDVAFRLCGEIEGVRRTFLLNARVAQVGAHSNNDVVLPFSGVSRSHCVLTAVSGGLIVEDRGSKNGTLVNGERAARARLAVGDELTVGMATLCLEIVDPADARLALIFESDHQPASIAESSPEIRETDLLESRIAVSNAAQLQWIEAFVETRRTSGASLGDALTDLGARLGSPALGVFVLRPEEEPVTLGIAGDLEALDLALDAHRTKLEQGRVRALASGWQLEALGAEDLTAGLSPVADGEVIALLILGDFPGRSSCGPWLRLLCRLLEILEGLEAPLESPWAVSAASRLSFPPGFVAGSSAATQRLYRELQMICGGDYPVLILGETGTGKEVVARTLHRSSPRSSRPFVAVNCAAIPADLLEAEMFGVARGAATGVAQRPGCFARAEGGTLFLDEIGEMQPELQAKLLRVLEYGEMQPVGGPPSKVDVRILSATNVDIENHLADKTLRADLYYRLAASVVTIPPLRERRGDLPALIQHFMQVFCEELGGRLRGVTHEALRLLMAYPWPGNVRELQHELRRLVQCALPGQTIDSELLPGKFRGYSAEPTKAPPEDEHPSGDLAVSAEPVKSLDLRERLAEVEREVIREALSQTGGHRVLTAKLLGISRNTLASKIALHGLSP